jgi:hypothetical protein
MFKTICIMFYPTSKRSQRWDTIWEAMSQWRESRPEPKAYNNSLRGYITVKRRSISETAYWGSKNPDSPPFITDHFNEIMRFAVKKEESVPHSGQSKGFSKIIILERHVKGIGTAKLTVGVRPDGEMVQYCISAAQPFEGAMAIA